MGSVASALIERRAGKAIAVVLTIAEREVYPKLTSAQQTKLRQVILDQFHDLTNLALELLEATGPGDGVLINEAYLEKIDRIHDALIPATTSPVPMSTGSNGHRSPSEFGGGRARAVQ